MDSREYTSQKVSERKNFEVGLLCSYVPSCDNRGGANSDPKGIWTNLVEVHKEMLHNKYQSSALSCFRDEKFWNLSSMFLCSNIWPPGWGQFWPHGHHMNKLGRGPLGDATYQISKLWAFFHFQRRKILKSVFFVPILQLVTPKAGPVLTHGVSYEWTW